MEITTTKENLVEKLSAQIFKNLEENLSQQDLTDEEKAAQMVLAKRKVNSDSESLANLVFAAFE